MIWAVEGIIMGINGGEKSSLEKYREKGDKKINSGWRLADELGGMFVLVRISC